MLRYAGGKSRAISQIQAYLPDEPIVSAFFGGGSVELYHSKRHLVIGNDIYEPLVTYWLQLQSNRDELKSSLRKLIPNKETYSAFKMSLHQGTPLERATKFFYVNRCCFSGCMTGGFSGVRFTPSCIHKLDKVDLSNIEFHNQDWKPFLDSYPNHFAYLDPPYDVPNLYLSDPFDHERLAIYLKTRNRWLMSYNDTPRIRELYSDCEIIPLKWKYGMTQKESKEILIRPKR